MPGGGTRPKLGYNAWHKLKIWTLRDIRTSEKGGLKDLKRVFGKFEIGGLKDLKRVFGKFEIGGLKDLNRVFGKFEIGGLKDLKRVFGKFEIGGLKDLNRVIEVNCQAWVLNCEISI